MICSKCGQECADDVFYCTNCGEKLSKEVQNEQVADNANGLQKEAKEKEEVVTDMEEKEVVETEVTTEGKSNKKIIGLAIGGVALLLIILIAVLSNLGDNSYTKYTEKSIIGIVEVDGDYCVCYANGDTKKLDEEKHEDYSVRYNLGMTVAAFLNEDEELVIFANGKEIATGIDEVRYYQVSASGDTVAYFTDCEEKEFKIPYYYNEWAEEWEYDWISRDVGTLNLYDVKKKKSEEIADEVDVRSAVLSPDGKTVAYVADYEVNDEDLEFTGYYSVNGKDSEELGDDKRVIAISDKAKYIYYTDEDCLRVLVKDEEVKLASDGKFSDILLNNDYSEMMFVSGGKTYITLDGAKKEKVCSVGLDEIMLKDDAATKFYSMDTDAGYVYVTNTGVDTFKENLFYSSDKDQVHYMLKKYETEKIASGVYMSDCIISDDGKSMVYLDGSKVMKVTKFTKGGEKEKLESVSKAYNIYANGDLSKIYVLDEKDELHYVKKGKEIEVAEDVTEVAFSPDGKYLYFVEDNETLYYTKNGKKSKEIFSVDDGSLEIGNYFGLNVLAENYDDGDAVMYRVKGKKAKELFTIEYDNE